MHTPNDSVRAGLKVHINNLRIKKALIYFIVDNHLSFALCRDTPFLPSPTGEGVTTAFGFSPLLMSFDIARVL